MAKKPNTSVVSKQIKKALATGTYDREVGEALRAALQALRDEAGEAVALDPASIGPFAAAAALMAAAEAARKEDGRGEAASA